MTSILDRLVQLYNETVPIERGKYRLAAMASGYRLRHGRREVTTRLGGGLVMELRLDDHIDSGIHWRVFERAVVRLVRDVLRPNWAFLDVGANIGYYTLTASRACGDAGIVHSFEPTPETFGRLSRHIELNHLTNVIAHQVALSDAAGEGTIHGFGGQSHGHASLSALSTHPVTGSYTCQVDRLDAYALDLPPCPGILLKLDVEGAEWSVLRGGAEFIAARKPIMVIEINHESAANFDYNPVDMFEWLHTRFGYSMRKIDVWGGIGPLGREQVADAHGANALVMIDSVHLPLLQPRLRRQLETHTLACQQGWR